MPRFLVCGVVLLALSSVGYAQLPSASAPALGMGDNYTALARGYSAVAWNPALLALPDNPRTSLAVLPVRVVAGLDPVTLADLARYDGKFLPATVRERWLVRIEREGGEQGTGGGDVTWLAAQAGPFALQVGTSMRALGNLTPGAAEVLLFGNFGRTNTPHALDLEGSHLSAFAASTLALSYARTVGQQMTAGATLKYTIGHVLLYGEDRGTSFTTDPVARINFPAVGPRAENFDANGGWGVGVDLGFAMVRGEWTFGATLQNAFNTFTWNGDDLVFRAGLGMFDVDTHVSDFDEREFAAAPAHLRDFVEDAQFQPTLAVGMARVLNDRVTITGDFRRRLADSSIELSPPTHLGAGAEYKVMPRFPLRGGMAYVTGGYQLSAGAGMDFGPVSFAASLMRRDTDFGVDTITMLTLVSTMSR